VPTLALFALFASFAYEIMRRDLDADLGRRLESIAELAATRVRPQYLVGIDPAENPLPSAYTITQRELADIVAATHAGRIYVFDAAHRSLCDTSPGVAIGHEYHELDLDTHELDALFAGNPTSSLTFRGSDGKNYKAGYAPIKHAEQVYGLRVEAPAQYFGALEDLQRRLLTYGALLAVVVVLVSITMAALITRPVRRLAAAAENIGRGDLVDPIPASGQGEIATLARTLDDMRQALRARDERLQMMLAGIAHEVRNPLGGIQLYAGILREELGDDAEKVGHVKRIERELGHLEHVVGDFLAYARRPRPELHDTDLAALCREVGEVATADAKAAEVSLTVDDQPARAHADAGQLRRALLNLVRNAIQATPAGGKVTLACRDTTLSVADTGKGMPPEQLSKIFDAFYTTKEQGTGLGLAFVKEIVADLGGKMDVQSTVGAGTTFTLVLKGL
jgi:signal transduction histidine kinase